MTQAPDIIQGQTVASIPSERDVMERFSKQNYRRPHSSANYQTTRPRQIIKPHQNINIKEKIQDKEISEAKTRNNVDQFNTM